MTGQSLPDSSALEDEFLAYALAQTHPYARECAGERLRSNLAEVIRRDVDWVTSAEFAQWHGGGREAFVVPPAAFNNRVIGIGPLRLIAGIRFRDRDGDRPFVSVERSNVPIGTLASATELAEAMNGAFRAFEPRALSFHHPSHLPLRIEGARPDFHVLIASAQAMVARADPAGLDRVTLSPCVDIDFYDRYLALYEDIYAERPWARAEIHIEDRESLADCREQGLLLHAQVDGVWSGIVAGAHWGRAAHGAVKACRSPRSCSRAPLGARVSASPCSAASPSTSRRASPTQRSGAPSPM